MQPTTCPGIESGSRSTGAAVAVCTIVLAVAAVAAREGFGLGDYYVAVVLGIFLAGGTVVLHYAARYLARNGFGAANRITLIRVALTALVLGLLGAEPSAPAAWFAAVAATCALILDGLDGAVARRRGGGSAFGARFDMETDAAMIMVLAVLAWHFEKAGAWVLLSGLLRYLFVAAGVLLPWLRAELPPSLRRKTVCVVQVASLLVCLVPLVPAQISNAVAAAGLVALTLSFAVDVALLARRSGPEAAAPLPSRVDAASSR